MAHIAFKISRYGSGHNVAEIKVIILKGIEEQKVLMSGALFGKILQKHIKIHTSEHNILKDVLESDYIGNKSDNMLVVFQKIKTKADELEEVVVKLKGDGTILKEAVITIWANNIFGLLSTKLFGKTFYKVGNHVIKEILKLGTII